VKRQRIVVEIRRAHAPAIIAAIRLLDLDDGRTEIRQNRAGIRSR
jgi:hypothetical protein